MSTTITTTDAPQAKTLGLLAEFFGPDELVEAARKATTAGYRRVEAFSPFPIHGIDDALRARGTRLPWLVFLAGLTGCVVALAMQYYMNATEGWWPFSGYQYNISAKPLFSLPANIPVTFELIILLSAFGAFFGMWALNGLPRLSNPLLTSERFGAATSHGFFLWVDAGDAKFAEGEAADFLRSIGAAATEPICEQAGGRAVPGWICAAGAVAIALALVPPLWIGVAAGKSSNPRLSIWWCMDYQPKYKPQTQTSRQLFADGRAMRARVPGTVPRGALGDDLRYFRGFEPEGSGSVARAESVGAAQFVALDDSEPAPPAPGAESDGGPPPADGLADGLQDPNLPEGQQWVRDFPERLEVNAALMDRGQERYNINCASCHGLTGKGNGLVTQRAQALQTSTWSQPTSLHIDDVRKQPVGKIFGTITHGLRKMPAYAQQISIRDRWAIVLYVKALQRSQRASQDDVPGEELRRLGKVR